VIRASGAIVDLIMLGTVGPRFTVQAYKAPLKIPNRYT
jgi:hypothetical protein